DRGRRDRAVGDRVRRRRRRRGHPGQGRGPRRDPGLRPRPGRRGHLDRGVPRPGWQRVRRLPPAGVLSDPAFYRGRSLWLDGVASAGDPLVPRAPLPGPLDVDVAIVGAGYTGPWTAYYLPPAGTAL